MKSRSYYLGFVLLLSVLIALYLLRPWGLFFLNDDLIHVPLSSEAILGQRNSIRYTSDLSIYLDFLLNGKNPIGYHVSNFFFHFLSSVFSYIFCEKLRKLKIHNYSRSFSILSAVLVEAAPLVVYFYY
jgi:hypothetical protein